MKPQPERDIQIFTRFMQLGELVRKRDRYSQIADETGISWLRVRDIVIKQIREKRVKTGCPKTPISKLNFA